MRPTSRLAPFFFVVLYAAVAFSQQTASSVPNLINYSGTLHLPSSVEATVKVVGVTFAIYRQEDGGAPLWLETQNVTPDSTGHYTVLLGSTKSAGIPADLFNTQEPRWLGVQMEGEAEQPRVLLVSVPYAMKAGDAETVGGLPVSAFALKPSSSGPGNESVNTGGAIASALAGQVSGSGTTNYIPVWTSSTNLGNSTIYQSGTNVGIGTKSPTSMLSVAGSLSGNSVNTVTTYQIGGSNILSNPGGNLLLGIKAGSHSTGSDNTFLGTQAGLYNTTGSQNSFAGFAAGAFNTTGSADVFIGSQSGYLNTAGSDNTFIGTQAGGSNTTGNQNTFTGYQAGGSNTTGYQNTSLGYFAGVINTGNYNVFIGSTSGRNNTTGSSDIYIANLGCPSPCTENNTMRIGTPYGGGFGQNAAYIAGITGASTSSGVPVFIDTTGKLGTAGGTLASLAIENTTTQQTSANFNISGSGTVGGTLAGSAINSMTTYQIGGSIVLSTGNQANQNVFLGIGSGAGTNNTGFANTYLGYRTGYLNTVGNGNTAVGAQALAANTGGDSNTAIGAAAMRSNLNGTFNTALGLGALENLVTGQWNIALGNGTLGNLMAGSGNIALGGGEFISSGSGNIYIGDSCFPANCTESYTTRIGNGSNGTYIAGIYGATASGGIPVYINSTGQLGTASSSRRFKEQIHDMDDSTTGLMRLRPVTFLYKPEYDKGPRTLQYGLIAEEVAEVYPDLVAYEKDGQPYTVKYQYLTTMLLNEMQKQYHRAEAEARVITRQQDEIEALQKELRQQRDEFQQRLERLEKAMGTQVATARQ